MAANGMSDRDYKNWLKELSEDPDPDVRDIADYAKHCNWWLGNYWEVTGDTYEDMIACYPDYDFREFYPTEENYKREVEKGYYTFHGKYVAEWWS